MFLFKLFHSLSDHRPVGQWFFIKEITVGWACSIVVGRETIRILVG